VTRVAIVGTSQVAALKGAWDAIAAQHPRHQVSFFAVPMPTYRKLRLNDRLVFGLPEAQVRKHPKAASVVRRINRATAIDLSGVDRVILCGHNWPQVAAAALAAGFDIEGVREAGSPQLMSRPAFDAICADLAERTLPDPIWRNWSGPPIAMQALALPAESCLASRDRRFTSWRVINTRPAGSDAVFDLVLDAYEGALRRVGIAFLRQPSETRLPFGLTAAEHSRGSRRLGEEVVPHPDTDAWHMNAGYGVICFAAIFAWLDATTAAAPVPIS
jgi:hypothetical protein